MPPVFYESDMTTPMKLDAAAAPIQPARGLAPVPDAQAPAKDPGSVRRYVNPLLNSRAPAAWPQGDWSVAWKAELESGQPAIDVLYAGDRIVVENLDGWTLLSASGENLGDLRRAEGLITIDPVHRHFYHNEETGTLAARSLEDGELIFSTFAYLGSGYGRTLLARIGDKAIIEATEQEVMSAGPMREPDVMFVELQDLGAPLEIDDDKFLNSSQTIDYLFARPMPLLVTIGDGAITLAARDHLLRADLNLKVLNVWTGDFSPLAMSQDELGRVYMNMKTSGGERFRIFSPEGGRLLSVALPESEDGALYPPIVGYDHRVFLLLEDRILALTAAGDLAWDRALKGRAVGAVVTTDGYLVVTTTTELTVFDPQGEPRLIRKFQGEDVTAPPTMMGDGSLLIGTEKSVYRLVAEGSAADGEDDMGRTAMMR